MKKIVNFLFATAVAALAIISCQKKELATVDVNENETVESPIHFYATEIVTKTVFDNLSAGQYPTLWTSTNDVKISQNEANSVTATVTPKNSNTQADFTPSPAITSDGSGNYTIVGILRSLQIRLHLAVRLMRLPRLSQLHTMPVLLILPAFRSLLTMSPHMV